MLDLLKQLYASIKKKRGKAKIILVRDRNRSRN